MSLEYKFENRGTVQVRPTGSDKRSPCWYMLGAVLLLLLLLAAWMFVSGYLTPASSTGIHAMTLRGKMNEQEKLISKQTDSIRDLEEQLASARREHQVQVVANEELGKKFAVVEADLSTEREKLMLYEGILSPTGLDQGLHIQHFGIRQRLVDAQGKKVEQGFYQYHLVLAQIRGGDTVLDGNYTITVSGKQDGKSVTVTQTDVTPSGEKAQTAFSVKHYQSLEGNLLFPKDFTPESVKLKVILAAGDSPERLTKSYDWATFSKSRNDLTESTQKE
ncbi:MAG TPA: hypothetical protein PLE99_15530 [Candidatus Thiothrix moscowensis]|uniref:DUF6776 family protein n=1 Tax=unclassified Thiothrix TaxID=2636184 RepID=UPI0025EE9323|nr:MULTISPECIES: DUF6776 family protein [unclassified Thiothrix]HRJ54169.1 hypothetical protein [Candidatus Thiothrix moscowensis]HRJ94339.1 hypothetical protein [Candidatus Thiothrix moscowensis]